MNSRKSLPSLRALHVFEAAARCGSFTAAARELSVTQAAVSKTIKGLEKEFDRPLFLRSGRSIRLTRIGKDLYQRTQSALDYLEEGCAHVRTGDRAGVTVAANTAVSHFWLGPRLRNYDDQLNSEAIRLITTDNDADLADWGNDLVVLYGYKERIGWNLSKLFEEELVPVATRSYLEHAGLLDQLPLSPVHIAELQILDYDMLGAGWSNFGTWLEWAGIERKPSTSLRVFSNYALAVEAMLDSKGITLAARALLKQLIQEGQVLEISDKVLKTDRGFYLGFRNERQLSVAGQRLFEWLLGEVASL